MSGSLLGPVTDADLRRWQKRRYDLLGELLDLGSRRELPVLTWRVSELVLVGEAFQRDAGERRAAFEQWVTTLELSRWPERTSDTGRTHLHAVTQNWNGRHVDVAVLADVFEDDEGCEP